MEIVKYSKVQYKLWDEFVEQSINGTLMHTRKFLNYHPEGRFDDHSLLFYQKDKLAAVFPAAIVEGSFRSHPGSSYGGPVFDKKVSHHLATEVLENLVSYVKALKMKNIWMRLVEPVFERAPMGELAHALYCSGFKIASREISSAFPVYLCEDELSILKRFQKGERWGVQKATKLGVTVSESDDLDAYWNLLSKTLTEKYSVKPTHSLEDIKKLKELFPHQIQLFVAKSGTQLMGGVVLFHMNSTASHIMYSALDPAAKETCASSKLIFEVLKDCQKRKIRYLNYGVSTEPGTQGKTVNSKLYSFKRHLGFNGVLRDVFELDLF